MAICYVESAIIFTFIIEIEEFAKHVLVSVLVCIYISICIEIQCFFCSANSMMSIFSPKFCSSVLEVYVFIFFILYCKTFKKRFKQCFKYFHTKCVSFFFLKILTRNKHNQQHKDSETLKKALTVHFVLFSHSLLIFGLIFLPSVDCQPSPYIYQYLKISLFSDMF